MKLALALRTLLVATSVTIFILAKIGAIDTYENNVLFSIRSTNAYIFIALITPPTVAVFFRNNNKHYKLIDKLLLLCVGIGIIFSPYLAILNAIASNIFRKTPPPDSPNGLPRT